MLARDGVWTLRVGASRRGHAARILRAALHLSLTETAELLRLEEGLAWSGTEAEVRWLGGRLDGVGIAFEIMRNTT